MEQLISQVIATGTILETATGTREIAITFNIPFLAFLAIILTTAISLAVFYLFFRTIWAD
jgi:uncharacterized membrane protein